MKNVLITGGAGFIGGSLIQHLLENYKTINIINIDYLSPLNNLKVETIHDHHKQGGERYLHLPIDITNLSALLECQRLKKTDTIIHLAAKAGVRESINHAPEYTKTNVHGTQNILHLAKVLKIKKTIFASSSSVYGDNQNTPWNESELALSPISPYASTKLTAERMCQAYSNLYKMNIIALRFFTVYGPNQRPDLAIHKFFRQISEQQPISLFGNGSTSRDFTYIDDLISGIMKAIHYKSSGFEIFNLGTGKPTVLLDLVQTIKEAVGSEIIVNKLPQQTGDVEHTFASIKKAKEKLGYSPSTSLIEGIKKFNSWFEARERKYASSKVVKTK